MVDNEFIPFIINIKRVAPLIQFSETIIFLIGVLFTVSFVFSLH